MLMNSFILVSEPLYFLFIMLAVIAVIIYYEFVSHMNMKQVWENQIGIVSTVFLSHIQHKASKKVWSVSDVVTHYWKYSV